MGSDVFDDYLFIKFVVSFFYKFIWVETIVKSNQMLKIFSECKINSKWCRF